MDFKDVWNEFEKLSEEDKNDFINKMALTQYVMYTKNDYPSIERILNIDPSLQKNQHEQVINETIKPAVIQSISTELTALKNGFRIFYKIISENISNINKKINTVSTEEQNVNKLGVDMKALVQKVEALIISFSNQKEETTTKLQSYRIEYNRFVVEQEDYKAKFRELMRLINYKRSKYSML